MHLALVLRFAPTAERSGLDKNNVMGIDFGVISIHNWRRLTGSPQLFQNVPYLCLLLDLFQRIPAAPAASFNQSVELTATRRALTLSMTKPPPLRATRALGGGSSLLSR